MDAMLAKIIAYKREETERRKEAVSRAVLEGRARALPPPRPFVAEIKDAVLKSGFALIAEIKKASPSKGLIRKDFNPAALARAYERGGATCISVLTDEPSFQGKNEHLEIARAACSRPLLRKDFMLDPWQIIEARALGADCVLIIMAAVSDSLAHELVEAAEEMGLGVLVEVGSPAEIERALKLPVSMIGINNRDLGTFKTSIERTIGLAPMIPAGYMVVSESGIVTFDQIERLREAGAVAFLVGESLMRQPDVEAATRELLHPNLNLLINSFYNLP